MKEALIIDTVIEHPERTWKHLDPEMLGLTDRDFETQYQGSFNIMLQKLRGLTPEQRQAVETEIRDFYGERYREEP